MEPPLQPNKQNPNKEGKRGGTRTNTPPQKDAYAKLLSQHSSRKFNLYLEQYSKDKTSTPGSSGAPQTERLNIPQRRNDQMPHDLSDSSDFSPSSMKGRDESSLSLYMEKLSINNSKQEKPTKQSVFDKRQGQRRDTCTSMDGDIESGEELSAAQASNSQAETRSKETNRDSEPKEMDSPADQERSKKRRNRKKNSPLQADEERVLKSDVDAEMARSMSPRDKNKLEQPRTSANRSPSNMNKRQGGKGHKKQVYEPYMSFEEVSHGLKRGELMQGQLRINPKKYQEAFIPSPDDTRDLFLDGCVARNRALNGDIVVVQVLPQDQWKVVKSDTDCEPASEPETQRENVGRKTVKERGKDDQSCDKREIPETTQSNNGILQKTAKVVFIVEKQHSRAATGFLKFLPDKPFAMFAPVDHRVPRINVPLNDCPEDFRTRSADYANTLFICRITNWAADSNFAEGQLAKTLGQAGEIDPETEGILMECDVDFSEFSDEVLDCLPKNLPWSIPAEELSRRKDLRKECIFSIDPATARDLDDALSCKLLPDGNFEVGVHIADVTYFVKEGSALDATASQRATSVYLVQKVVPMLPRLLCEELCSLNPLTDRLTFSVIWTLSPEGKILSEWFGRSVIRSCVKLSYDHAQSMIDSPDKMFEAEELPPTDPEHPIDEIHQAVLNLNSVAKNLRAQRFTGGALRLDQLKVSFTLDKETMMPQGCYIYQYKDSNKLVEEFMLLANIATASHIYNSFPELALLRRHPPPKTKLVEELQELCDQLGIDVDFSSAGAIHKSLHAALGDDEYSAARKYVLTHMCSRSMQMALYFCSGALKEEKLFKHYALNVPLYTHFTSPIRRYPDIIVHRLLAASLKHERRSNFGLLSDEVQKQASYCNQKKTLSKRVNELSTELFFGVFVRECGPLESEAMVMGVLDQSFDVLVLSYGVQKRIYCKNVQGLKTFHHHKVGKKSELTLVWEAQELEGETREQVISIFAVLDVQLQADGGGAKSGKMSSVAVLKRPEGS